MRKKCAVACSLVNLAIFAVGVALLVLGLVFALSVIPKDLDDHAKQEYVLGTNPDGSFNDFTRRWRWRNAVAGPNGAFLEVYFYNYSNVLDVINLGLKPDVVEVGPYAYRALTNVDYEMATSLNGSALFAFTRKTNYVFDPSRSCQGCTPEDSFLIPDPIFFQFFDNLEKSLDADVEAICKQLGDKCAQFHNVLKSIPAMFGLAVDASDRFGPFFKVNVNGLLFDGFADPLYEKAIAGIMKIVKWVLGTKKVANLFPEPKYRFKANGSESTYTVMTGDDGYGNNGQIVAFTLNNVTSGDGTLPESWWNATDVSCDAEEARKLFGTIGDFFHPLLQKSESLGIFVEEMCRPVNLAFQREIQESDLTTFRYALDSSTFDYSNADNCGFCRPPGASFYGRSVNATCLPSGLLDLSQCTPDNMPIVASNPHFFDAESDVIKLFPRTVRKTKEREVITVDVEPKTGTVLRANKRLQFNVLFQQYPDIPSFSAMRSGVYPMFWINETFSINDYDLRVLREDLFGTRHTWKVVCYAVGVGLGAFLIAVSLLSCVITLCKASKQTGTVRITPPGSRSVSAVPAITSSPSSGEIRSRDMGRKGLFICSGVNVLLFLAGCGLICAGLVVWLSVFPDQFHKQLKENKVLGENADGSLNDYTRSWMDGTGIRQNYYFFNYTNVIGIVDRGAKPDVYEKGPYTYKKIYTYDPPVFIDDTAELEYSYRTSYVFDPENSCPTCHPNDTFIVPDIVFQVLIQSVSSYDNICEIIGNLVGELMHLMPLDDPMIVCNNILPNLAPMLLHMTPEQMKELLHAVPDIIGLGVDGSNRFGPFVAVKVEDLLFKGYRDPLFDKLLKRLVSLVNSLDIGVQLPDIPDPLINLVVNNSMSPTYTVRTGKNNYLDIGKMLGFADGNVTTNGTSLPDGWWSPPANLTTCTDDLKKLANALNGTNGQFFHVLMDKGEKPYVYVDDLCRSLRFVYDSDVTVRDVDGFRFVIDPNTFNYEVPENCGFCTELTSDFYDRKKGSFCLPDGILHLGGCKQMPMKLPASLPLHLIKIPIVASNPHFYGSDPEVIDLFPRFNPTKEEDMTTLDIEPQTGTLLRANKRLQMNVMVRRFKDVASFSQILPGAYPMFWINETYLIDDSSWHSLKDQVLGTKQTIKLVCYIVGVGLGALLIVISLVSCFANICCFNRTHEHTTVQEDSKFQDRHQSSALRTNSTAQLRARPTAARRKE